MSRKFIFKWFHPLLAGLCAAVSYAVVVLAYFYW